MLPAGSCSSHPTAISSRFVEGNLAVACFRLLFSCEQKCLARFKSDPSIRVLLLPIRHGAKGLNLTEVD